MNLSAGSSNSTPDILFFSDGAAALFACNFLVGLPANVYVVRLIAGGAGGPVASELFALNLSVSEILFCFLSLYMMLHFLLRMSVDIGLQVLRYVIPLVFMSRPTFQSCICLVRYLAVVHPAAFLRFRPLRYRLAYCCVSWLLLLLCCIVPVFHLSDVNSAYLLVFTSLFLLLLMLYCDVHVLCVLRQSRPGDGDRDCHSRNAMRRKAFRVIMITLVFTSTNQLLLLSILGPVLWFTSQQALLLATLVSLSISIVCGFITPLLYLHRVRKLPCIHL